jgi:hypothetical protein
MTRVDETPCWLVLAPLSPAELAEVVDQEWRREVPYALGPPPWFVIPAGAVFISGGTPPEPPGTYAAVVSAEPGTEGPDRPLAARCSVLTAPQPVYSLLLDPDLERVCIWVAGELVAETDEDPRPLTESLGLQLPRWTAPTLPSSVAVVEDASLPAVQQVLDSLGDTSWIQLTPSRRGVLVSSDSGPLGTQAWDIAEALPAARVYYVQREVAVEAFSVVVLRGAEEVGWLRIPPLDDDTPRLTDILGASTPAAILDALDIPPDAL